MAKPVKDLEAQIKEVQDSIKKGKIYLDKGLLMIEDLEGQIQASQERRAIRKARTAKLNKKQI